MNREDILNKMDIAFKEDRERFFKVADTLHLQPKYSAYLEELEVVKQIWRDMPQREDYPQMKHPQPLPSWFPKVNFASCWDVDYLKNNLD